MGLVRTTWNGLCDRKYEDAGAIHLQWREKPDNFRSYDDSEELYNVETLTDTFSAITPGPLPSDLQELLSKAPNSDTYQEKISH